MDTAPPITPSEFRCTGCGYDLTGAVIGGHCPECGLSVQSSLRANTGDKTSSNATIAMILGILSLTVCGPLGIVAIIYSIRAKQEMNAGGFSQSSRSMAMAGLILGIIATALIGLIIGIIALSLVIR